MRYSIITLCFFCFATSLVRAQPVPASPVYISEDDLKLGNYDNAIFQPAEQHLFVQVEEGSNKDGELLFLIHPEPFTLRVSSDSPFITRLYQAYQRYTEGDEMLVILIDLLGYGDVPGYDVAGRQ
jgi:hypothetical protein